MTERGQRLLVIESNPLQGDLTRHRLELLAYGVEVVATAQEAWAAIARERPDAILLSLDGDRLEAVDLIEKFSSDTDTADLPILVTSSEADLDLVEKAWKNGAQEYLVTPYDPQVLERKVASLKKRELVGTAD